METVGVSAGKFENIPHVRVSSRRAVHKIELDDMSRRR